MNPYLTIWFSPQKTFRYLFSKGSNPSLFLIPILILGISIGLDGLSELEQEFGDKSILVFIISMVIGVLTSFFYLAIVMPWLIKLVGKLWGGHADRLELANVCSISMFPYLLALLYQITKLVLGLDPDFVLMNMGFIYLLRLWCFCLFIIGVSVVQGFTYGMALLNIFVASIPFIILGLILTK